MASGAVQRESTENIGHLPGSCKCLTDILTRGLVCYCKHNRDDDSP